MRGRWYDMRWVGLVLAGLVSIGDATDACAHRDGQAYSGRPFGVAQITVPMPESPDGSFVESDAYQLVEKNGRVFYPVIAARRVSPIVSEILGEVIPNIAPNVAGAVPNIAANIPDRLRISFLFTGDEPLDLTLLTPEPQRIVLRPEPPRRARSFQRTLDRWWKDYADVAREQQEEGDYPPLVHAYLTTMLSQRLGLQPSRRARRRDSDSNEMQQVVGLVLGAEDLRTEVLQETMRGGGGLGEPASIPLPAEVEWQAVALPEGQAVDVEPIAMHVPEECFYIRFGNFTNYMWVDHLKEDYGGDIGRMVTLRGHNAKLSEKTQHQLALKKSALADIVGPQMISDVAMIGRDLYLREGPAMGMLFEAKNSVLFAANLAADRKAAQVEAQADGATIETIQIAGHNVTLLSTPDNRLRSFHAIDGNYHLVTTSGAIVERFYEASAGKGALGASAEFQHARQEMPLSRDDTIFAYFSSAFFRSLLSPRYQIELLRRLQSITDMELIQLAKFTAKAEGHDFETISELIAGGFLPRGFGQRGDSKPPLHTDEGFVDPQRGARGTFTPIPDVRLTAITPTEEAYYNRSAQFLKRQWPQMDPLMVGIQRYALEQDRRERIVIDANVSPLAAEEKYGWLLSMIGPPTDVHIESSPTDVITAQMSLKGGFLWPAIPPHHLFVGVQDIEPAIAPVPDGLLGTIQFLRMTPGYLGAWPELGLLNLLPFLSSQPDVFGFSQLPFGLWRWQGDGFSVLSFHDGVLTEAAEHLQPVPTENPAQIRVRVSDLAQSKLANWISALNYFRAYEASRGNVRLLNTLIQQLAVPQPQALAVANQLLGTQLVCPLGGTYELAEGPQSSEYWRSTEWPATAGVVPAGYEAPLLDWFRGASIDVTKAGDRLFLHAELDIQRQEHEPAVKLPLFNLFGGKKNAKPSKDQEK